MSTNGASATAFPLADVRVLSIEQYGAGPWATMQLADLGADVIKVEDPTTRGDVGRYVPPFQEGEDSLFFETLNRNKRSISLDLRRPESRAVLEDLVRGVDVVYSNLRGDQPAKLRITYADLAHVNPRIVCCSLSGFGMTGPRAAEGGYDYMMQALAGWMSLTGAPDGPPEKSGLSLVDLSAGYVAVIAILAGLWRARRDGVGCDCDISLYETALAQLLYVGTWTATKGYTPPRRANSAHPSIVPFQNFETADGWIVVSCPKPKFWELLCAAVGLPELLADERFTDFAARDTNREELIALLAPVLRADTTASWIARLTAAGVPSAEVKDVAAALEDEQAIARGSVWEYEHPRLGPVRQVGSPLRLSGALPEPQPSPARGVDTEAVLRELCGYDDARLDTLATDGVFGDVVTRTVSA